MPAADQANASQADPPGLTFSVSVSALQHLIIEVLRRPVEFTLLLEASASPGSTVGADKGYDVARFVADVRVQDVTPHVAQKVRGSAIDGRTTRHAGYHVSQRKQKLVEQVFGWMKTVGGLRKLRHRGIALVDWQLTFAATAYNLVRLRNLEARCP